TGGARLSSRERDGTETGSCVGGDLDGSSNLASRHGAPREGETRLHSGAWLQQRIGIVGDQQGAAVRLQRHRGRAYPMDDGTSRDGVRKSESQETTSRRKHLGR